MQDVQQYQAAQEGRIFQEMQEQSAASSAIIAESVAKAVGEHLASHFDSKMVEFHSYYKSGSPPPRGTKGLKSSSAADAAAAAGAAAAAATTASFGSKGIGKGGPVVVPNNMPALPSTAGGAA